MKFEVKINMREEEENEILLSDIKKVIFKNDTVDDYSRDRTGNIINTVEIIGEITPENKETTKKLIEWSLSNKASEIYRKVEIKANQNEDEVIREYVLDYAFAMDYTEKFNESNAEYELKLSQRQANLNDIKAYS